MKLKFDVSSQELVVIQQVLQRTLPAQCKVWVFGSRVKHQAKYNSDLDLAIECQQALDKSSLMQLETQFDESRLPYSVDVVDMQKVEPYFKEIIDQQKVLFPLIANVPELRFSGFLDGWNINKVGELCDFIVPGRNKPKSFEGDIPWITTPDIDRNGSITKSKSELTISKNEAKNIGSKIVPINSVVISCVGELGLVAVTENEIVINQQLHAFTPKRGISYQFLFYELSMKKRYMERVATKTTVPYINKDNCNSIPITYPIDSKEQQKIAAFLGLVDDKLNKLCRKRELLETWKRGLMQKIFSQQLRFKQDDGTAFPDWEEEKLREFTGVYDGTHQTPTYVKSGVPFYSVEHLTGNQFKNTKFIAEDIFTQEQKRVSLEKNDILMTRIGDIGTCKLIDWEVRASFYVSLALIKQSDGFVSGYMSQFISSSLFQKELHKRTIHVAFPKKINLGEIGNCHVLLPCRSEQQKIADFLSSVDKKIEAVVNKITQTETFKKGLLQKMFV